MADRPILFSGPMVRALLAGTKTQTRRAVKPQPFIDAMGNFCAPDRMGTVWNYGQDAGGVPHIQKFAETKLRIKVGDRLYVRESIATTGGPVVRYAATDAINELRKLTPSIHMPRWASRLTLTVTDVRVERLQDISEADAVAEGCVPDNQSLNPNHIGPARDLYSALWNSINGGSAWDANPWVAAYTFTVHRHNIDAMPAPAPAKAVAHV